MNRTTLLICGLLASAIAVTGCSDDKQSSTTPDASPDAGGETIQLTGFAFDDMVYNDEPLVGAIVVVDTGDGLITTETGDDGMFTVDVPVDTVVAVTVAAEDRWAATFADIDPATDPQPIAFPLSYYNKFQYDVPEMVVSGTITGAPAGSYVFFYGEDSFGNKYVQAPTGDPVEYEVTFKLFGDREKAVFTALAMDGFTAEVYTGVLFEVDRQDELELDIDLPADPLVDMTITTNQPLLNGELLTEHDPDSVYNSAMPILPEYFNDVAGGAPLLGFTLGLETLDDGFRMTIPHLPPGDEYAVSAYMQVCSDFDDPGAPVSYGIFPLDGTDNEIEFMDSPVVEEIITFEPGATISWEPVDGAVDYQLMVIEDGWVKWFISTRKTEVTFPNFPADFDKHLLFDTGAWTVRSRDCLWSVDETEFDLADLFRGANTPGALATWGD